MKQIISLMVLVTIFAFTVKAQGPVMTFDITSIDYGTIDKGTDRIKRFKFTNTGNEPLIIKAAKSSCGCLMPTYPKEPIMPGESNVIDVNYDTHRVGSFTKTVTVTTNENSDTHTLTVKGEVKAPPTQESVPASTGGFKQ